MDLVVDKSGAADAISERIEYKDGVKSGKANRMFQLLLIGWATFAFYIYYISNVQSDPSGVGAVSTLSVLCHFFKFIFFSCIFFFPVFFFEQDLFLNRICF